MPIHRWILAIATRLVPKTLRADWRAEWDAELHHRESMLGSWTGRERRRRDLIGRTTGALWDAFWLQSTRWRSLRLFAHHWRMALAALSSLSVALAATVIGFATYNALLFRPPGVGDPGSLREIAIRSRTDPFGPVSFEEYTDYRNRTRVFSDIAAFPHSITTMTVILGDRHENGLASEASGNFFPVLAVSPHLGRVTMRSAAATSGDEVVLSYPFWQKLGADRGIVGKTVRINDHPATIAGVLPASFRGMTLAWEPDLWMSLETNQRVFGSAPTMLTDRTQRWLHMAGRLRPGMSESDAIADVSVVSAGIEHDHPVSDKSRTAVMTALTVTPPGDRGWMLQLVGGLVLVVLLTLVVACANVTNLLLGLAASRRHEMLVRAAIGASRVQLIAPLLRESLLLCLVAGGLGLALAYAALINASAVTPSLGAFFPAPSIDLRPDAVVVGATLIVTFAVGIAIGVPPALRAAAEGISVSLSRELVAAEPRKARIRNVLVVIQMAVATLAMIGVGVSIRSFVSLRHVSPGFAARSLIFSGVDMRRSGFDERSGPPMYTRIRDVLSRQPGVEAIALADNPPLVGGAAHDYVVRDGDPPPLNGRGAAAPYSVVDAAFFTTLGIPVLAGRTFDSRDRLDGPEVVVINRTMAERQWPGGNAIGQRLRIENGNRLVQVIGVVADGKYQDLTEPQLPFMYFALEQHYLTDVTVIARTSSSQPPSRDVLQRALFQMSPGIVFGGIGLMTLDDLFSFALVLPRLVMRTVTVIGVLTLALAVLGLYSTVFYAVNQRRSEIGVRVALGARSRDLFALTMRQTGWVALTGATLGVVAGVWLLPLVSSFFYGIRPAEPGVVGAVALVGVSIALLTTYIVTRPWTRLASQDLLRRHG